MDSWLSHLRQTLMHRALVPEYAQNAVAVSGNLAVALAEAGSSETSIICGSTSTRRTETGKKVSSTERAVDARLLCNRLTLKPDPDTLKDPKNGTPPI